MDQQGLLDMFPTYFNHCKNLTFRFLYDQVFDGLELLVANRILGIWSFQRLEILFADQAAWNCDLSAAWVIEDLLNQRILEVDFYHFSIVEGPFHEDTGFLVLVRYEDHSCGVSSKCFLDHDVDVIHQLGEADWSLIIFILGHRLELARHESLHFKAELVLQHASLY